ncbi:hypothetical protein DOTSEDRAFT_83911 [Dothistroma septosporum NZE10]|uniref:Uncharacterized protein n=1 Tax=Dothistroma septosporum (strain NZE10 / CBS 128990) TaxID=675120 RepID=N1PCJ8_DOTSN|nr:hypothetical protein DOTSEDRAFT_83911 [Dothistroma septosporum NZE10]
MVMSRRVCGGGGGGGGVGDGGGKGTGIGKGKGILLVYVRGGGYCAVKPREREREKEREDVIGYVREWRFAKSTPSSMLDRGTGTACRALLLWVINPARFRPISVIELHQFYIQSPDVDIRRAASWRAIDAAKTSDGKSIDRCKTRVTQSVEGASLVVKRKVTTCIAMIGGGDVKVSVTALLIAAQRGVFILVSTYSTVSMTKGAGLACRCSVTLHTHSQVQHQIKHCLWKYAAGGSWSSDKCSEYHFCPTSKLSCSAARIEQVPEACVGRGSAIGEEAFVSAVSHLREAELQQASSCQTIVATDIESGNPKWKWQLASFKAKQARRKTFVDNVRVREQTPLR